ncbi:MAG TPA: hypothetical protein VIM79_16080 [Niastella sp.]
MKKLLLPVLLCTSTLLFAQTKTEDFIKKYGYAKISATILIPKKQDNPPLPENNPTAGVFGTIGAKMRYAALGFSAGYFNLGPTGPVTPVGFDVTLTDFKKKKAFPVITAQWHKAHFKEHYSWGRIGHYSDVITGNDMYSIGGGMAFPVSRTAKLQVTVGFSKLNYNRAETFSDALNPASTRYFKGHQNMVVLATSVSF